MLSEIIIPFDEIAAFCQRNHIRRLSLFGSVLRSDFQPESDIDMLVEFETGHVPGFITLSKLRLELSQIMEREVDLRTPASLSDYFRDEVVANAHVIYEQRR